MEVPRQERHRALPNGSRSFVANGGGHARRHYHYHPHPVTSVGAGRGRPQFVSAPPTLALAPPGPPMVYGGTPQLVPPMPLPPPLQPPIHPPPPQNPPSAPHVPHGLNRYGGLQEPVEELIAALEPCHRSEERRSAIFQFVRSVIQDNLPFSECYLMGSYPLKAYLPDSDLDMTILISSTEVHPEVQGRRDGCDVDDEWLVLVNKVLCRAAIAESSRPKHGMEIRNISFINARTKVVNCVVQNVSVDITINQTGSLASLTLLEEVDRHIGCDHLFKRSLLLVKAWCLHETPKYTSGVSVLGSKAHGGLSSYALSVMIVALFNDPHGPRLRAPLHVFVRFLQVYSSFDWAKSVVTVDGPMSKSLATLRPGQFMSCSEVRGKSRLCDLIRRVREQYEPRREASRGGTAGGGVNGKSSTFQLRCCNIEDPLNPTNNLGYSLNRQSLQFLQYALSEGYRHLEHLLAWSFSEPQINGLMLPPCLPPPEGPNAPHNGPQGPSPPPFLPVMPSSPHGPVPIAALYFPRLFALYADPKVRRSDLLDHPCEARADLLVCDETASRLHTGNRGLMLGDLDRFWRALRRVQVMQQQERQVLLLQQQRLRRDSQVEQQQVEEDQKCRGQDDSDGRDADEDDEAPHCSERPQQPPVESPLPIVFQRSPVCSRCASPRLCLSPAPRQGPAKAPVVSSTRSNCSCTCSHDTALMTFTTSSLPSSPSSLSSLSSQSPPPLVKQHDDSGDEREADRVKLVKDELGDAGVTLTAESCPSPARSHRGILEHESDPVADSMGCEVPEAVSAGGQQEEARHCDLRSRGAELHGLFDDAQGPTTGVLSLLRETEQEEDQLLNAHEDAAVSRVNLEDEPAALTVAEAEERSTTPSLVLSSACSQDAEESGSAGEEGKKQSQAVKETSATPFAEHPSPVSDPPSHGQDPCRDEGDSGSSANVETPGVGDDGSDAGGVRTDVLQQQVPTEPARPVVAVDNGGMCGGGEAKGRQQKQQEGASLSSSSCVEHVNGGGCKDRKGVSNPSRRKRKAGGEPKGRNQQAQQQQQPSQQPQGLRKKGQQQQQHLQQQHQGGGGGRTRASQAAARAQQAIDDEEFEKALACCTASLSRTRASGLAGTRTAFLAALVGLLCVVLVEGLRRGPPHIALTSLWAIRSHKAVDNATVDMAVQPKDEEEEEQREAPPRAYAPHDGRPLPPILTHWVALGTALDLGVDSGLSSRRVRYVWAKDGVPWSDDLVTDPTLTIAAARPEDEGEYVLYMSKPVGPDGEESGDELVLLGRSLVRIAEPPKLVPKPRTLMRLKPGGMLVLSVTATGGLPPPSFQWFKNGVKVPNGSNSVYAVRNVTAEVSGNYTCEAWNVGGRVTWEEAAVYVSTPEH